MYGTGTHLRKKEFAKWGILLKIIILEARLEKLVLAYPCWIELCDTMSAIKREILEISRRINQLNVVFTSG